MAKTIYANNQDLTRDKQFTYLSEDIVSAGSTIRVQSILGFQSLTTSSGQIVLIGEIGNEKSEILRTSKDTAPSSAKQQVSLRDSLAFDHPQDTKVYIIDYNRFQVQHASTVTGTKSTLTAFPLGIQPDLSESLYRDITKTSGFYFVRFNESIDDTNSDFSDAIPFAGYDDNTVFEIKRRALESVNEKIDDELITHDFLNKALWQARREYHKSPGKRPFRRKFNTDIGNVLTGSFRIELPVEVEKPFTAENIFGVRIGTEANMFHYDKKDLDFDYRNNPHSTLDVPYTRGTSTSIWLANGRDFDQTGVLSVEGTNIGYERVAATNYESLTITSHGSWSASAGSDAWQNITYGLPDKFTVFAEPEGSAYIYFNRPMETLYIGQNIWSDYYRTLVGYDSDADVLDEPEYDMYVHYLAWRIKKRKNLGLIDTEDNDFKLWQSKKQNALNNEYLGTKIRIEPDVDHLPFPS